MFRRIICLLGFALVAGLSGIDAEAAPPAPPGLEVHTLFSDDAVLQRNIEVPVWGTAPAGNDVTVEYQSQSKLTTADTNGDWMVILDPMSVSGPNNMVITSGSDVITVLDVQVGEVWVCSGQSNMLLSLGSSTNGDEAIADSINHNINYYQLGTREKDFSNTFWTVGNPDTAGDSYAIAWYFAHALQHWFSDNSQNMPIGLLQMAQGGTEIKKWFHTNNGDRDDGELYELKIMPVMPYAIQGAIWHQGEADGWPDRAPEYYWKLPGLIAEWRYDWGQGYFPFIFGQTHWHTKEEFAWVRDAQLHTFLTIEEPNVGMPVTCDWPDGSGHPPYKKFIGERMALFARKICYDDSLVYSGPIIDKANSYINGSEIVLAWDHLGSGLTTSDGNDPAPFKIAGSDGVYYDATAQIVGDTVVVSSGSVSSPEAVRYIYNYGVGNLINVEGLPATPIMLDLVKEPDSDAPKPDPLLWQEFPEATGPDAITMIAQPSYDYASRYESAMTEYYFDETSGNPGGNDSGWQDSRYYTDSGLQQNTTYTYQVRIRDKSTSQNESAWSSAESATTELTSTPTPTPTPTPTQTPTPTPTQTPTPTPTTDMYVNDIAMTWYEQKSGYYAARATVWIKDEYTDDVDGATVTGEWSGATASGDEQGQTGQDGKVTLESKAVKGGGTFTFTVTDVSATGFTYNRAMNVIDSNSITAP